MGPERQTKVASRPPSKRVAPHHRFFPIPRREELAGWAGLYPGEPENARRDLRKFATIWIHLALLLGVMKVYAVEGRALLNLTTIALIALPVHYLLEFRWKKPFFLVVSVIGLFDVFGVVPGLAISALALAFIGVCRLPVAWTIRAAMIAAAAVGLGFARASFGSSRSELASIVWPILGSMLMFRMILYLYEIKYVKKPEPLVDTLGYFFLLPNYAFRLFPVVDYRTLIRSHFAAEIHETQSTGLKMIFNGVVQLLAYRVVFHQLLIPAQDVDSPAALAAHVVCNYLLYLQVSGQFHIACGMLHLFGYRLPTTHHHYFLASSFTDYWRRINIYWKDFMIRVVFNPVAFRLKRKPRWLALAVATSAVFVTTWLLHAYQMFWLQGRWGFSVPDALFWGILGAFVLINVQLDAREKPRKPGKSLSPLIKTLVHVGKVVATFVTISLLWSLWYSPSLTAWFAMFRRAFAG